jgi:two-component system, LuxR family, response regulator FixJ
MTQRPIVFVVDDDAAVRGGLSTLLTAAGLDVRTYASAQEFLEQYDPGQPGCLILDIRMPGMDGLDLQEQLTGLGSLLPVIILSGHADVPAAVRALKGGALDLMEKPFEPQLLLTRVREAIERDTALRRKLSQQSGVAERLAGLTHREREIMELILAGRANKVIAIDLGISERTVEFHRANVMKKMRARSLTELINLVRRVDNVNGTPPD